MQNDKNFRPDRIGAYFRIEWLPLALVTVSGLIYNIGLLATPWFEGRLAQCLADILDGSATAAARTNARCAETSQRLSISRGETVEKLVGLIHRLAQGPGGQRGHQGHGDDQAGDRGNTRW